MQTDAHMNMPELYWMELKKQQKHAVDILEKDMVIFRNNGSIK